MKKIALISLGLSGLFLINSANADQTTDAMKQAMNAVGDAKSQNDNLTRDRTISNRYR